jgi:hypothetical protein
MSRSSLHPQRLLDLVNLEVHDDRPFDVEGRCGLVAVRAAAHFGCGRLRAFCVIRTTSLAPPTSRMPLRLSAGLTLPQFDFCDHVVQGHVAE